MLQPQDKEDNFPFRRIWESGVPFYTAFFAWWHIQTIDNLIKRNIGVDNNCSLCEVQEECIDHVLLKCNFSKPIWDYFQSSFGRQQYIPNSAKLAPSKGLVLGPLAPKAGWMQRRLVKAIMWTIWKERNQRILEPKKRQFHNMVADVKELLFNWSKENVLFASTNFWDFIVEWEVLAC